MTITFKAWNQQQKNLRTLLEDSEKLPQALEACLEQHGWTHESDVWSAPFPTFADQLWQGLSEHDSRRIPPKGEHSIAWNYWHIARIEDTVFNLLVAGSPMVLDRGNWLSSLNISQRHTGNLMPLSEIHDMSQQIDLQALREYRVAVGLRTREIIQSLTTQRLSEKVSQENIQEIRLQQAVLPEAEDLLAYWGKRSIRGLLLMPATRHNMVHLNEVLSLKKKFA